jgi:hypothetical protein
MEAVWSLYLIGLENASKHPGAEHTTKVYEPHTYISEVAQAIRDWFVRDTYPYLTSNIAIAEFGDSRVPIVWVQDEYAKGESRLIPTIFRENLDPSFADVYLMTAPQMPTRKEGMIHAVVDLEKNMEKLRKRYARQHRKYDYTMVYGGRAPDNSRIQSLCELYTEDALNYFESRGIVPSIANDVYQMITSAKRCSTFTAIEARVQSTNFLGLGVGVFSNVCTAYMSEPQVYWDFTRHGNHNGVGNGILYEAVTQCYDDSEWSLSQSKKIQSGFRSRYLNLGVGYYNWKFDQWYAEPVYYPSVDKIPMPHQVARQLEYARDNHNIVRNK